MKLSSLWFRCVIACVVFCTFFSAKLSGCMRSLADVKVPPSFRISVWQDAKVVPGITLEVYDEALPSVEGARPKPYLTLRTDQNGNAEVKDLAPGAYVIGTAGPGQGSAVYAIVATDHPKPTSEIKLEWPYSRQTAIKSHALRGDLISNKPWNPFENIHLELWTAGSYAPLAAADTGPDGHFHFDESRSGTYILRIRGHQKDISQDEQVKGDVVIELSPSAPDATEISLRLDMTDCGITYNNCPANKPVAMASRRIQVLYPPGMAEYPTINGAHYRLMNDNGIAIAEGFTDKNGIAELPSDATGKATLIVASPLMATLKQTLNLLSLKVGAPDLAVTLTQLEECSTARLEKHAP
jgi:hypothetical protein